MRINVAEVKLLVREGKLFSAIYSVLKMICKGNCTWEQMAAKQVYNSSAPPPLWTLQFGLNIFLKKHRHLYTQ